MQTRRANWLTAAVVWESGKRSGQLRLAAPPIWVRADVSELFECRSGSIMRGCSIAFRTVDETAASGNAIPERIFAYGGDFDFGHVVKAQGR